MGKRVVPTGNFKIERNRNKLFFYPNGPLKEPGIFFVAERKKDGSYLLHDNGTIMEASLRDAMDAVDVIRELRFGTVASGFRFRDGRVFTKVGEEGLVDAVRRLERLASEIYHKSTSGLGG